jgi:hypothetical protein
MIPRDVATCWNYTYKMLNFAHAYYDMFNELTSNWDMKMRKYEIEDSEWEIVKQLADVLKVRAKFSNCFKISYMPLYIFKDATLFFSCATPNLPKVIPAMDHIDQHLATAACNNTYKLFIQAVVAMDKKLLNKYYMYTNHSELYRITISKYFPRSWFFHV